MPRLFAHLVLSAALAPLAVQAQETLTGADAFGGWQDDAPGTVRQITAADLPPADPNPEDAHFAAPVPRPEGAGPKLPEGFSAELVVEGLKNPRLLRIAPNGDLFVADSKANQVRVYRLKEGSAEVEAEGIFSGDLHEPYGIAFFPPGDAPEWVYIANSHSVVRFPYTSGDMEAGGEPETIVENIPAFHHWTRDILFAPDGSRLYLAVGSGSNVALDMAPEPRSEGGLEGWIANEAPGATWDTEEGRAQVLSYAPDGNDGKAVATGLRNCSGMAIRPDTGALWCAVNERDGLGPDTPFDYATEVEQGAFYGWPWYYIGSNPDDRPFSDRLDLAEQVKVPDVLFQAHSAPLGITFYSGDAFPEAYRDDAFVAMHGSWNRGKRTGYKVVRLHFENGEPTGAYEDFMTGFVLSEDEVWGRPVGLAVGADGALLVSEDGSGSIWRVTHDGN